MTTLPVMRASELSEQAAESRWLIRSLWARSGVGILGGAPKCCKSWLGLDIAVSVASETPCLGYFDVADPGGALVYMAEDALATVKDRILGICRHRGLDLQTLPLDVITAPSLRLDLERDQERLVEAVHRLKPRLLLLDPFVRLHRIDENNSGDVSQLLGYLRELQRRYDLAIVVTHHARKNGPAGAQAGQGLRGSGDLHAWGDSNLYLRRTRDTLTLTVEHRAASSLDPFKICLVVEHNKDAHLEIDTDRTENHVMENDIEAAVLAALEPMPLSRTHLRSIIQIRNERLGQLLAQLTRDGQVMRYGDKWGLSKSQ